MARGVLTLLILVLNLVLLLSEPALSLTDIKCPKVVSEATPCLNYVRDKSDKPSGSCCNGVKALKDMCKTKSDRQAACECLKKAVGHMKIDVGRILGLPKKCGVKFYLHGINDDIDCKLVP